MIKPFNRLNLDVSCLGNHEIEIGIDHGTNMLKKVNFPTIMSNLLDLTLDETPLCECLPFKVVDAQGFKIGLLGFAEEAWLD